MYDQIAGRNGILVLCYTIEQKPSLINRVNDENKVTGY